MDLFAHITVTYSLFGLHVLFDTTLPAWNIDISMDISGNMKSGFKGGGNIFLKNLFQKCLPSRW